MVNNGFILVIEDSKLQRAQVLDLLGQNNFQTDFAVDGKSALEKLTYQKFNLILLDMVLPDFTGIQLISKIRELEKAKNTPIIVLSGLTDKENVVESLGLGIHDYITKPFHPKELINRMNIHLQLQLTHQKLVDANTASSKFLGLLGHDLKGAFGNLYSTFELIDKHQVNGEDKSKLLKLASQSAKKASELLDALILWGKAINDGIIQQNEKFDLNMLAVSVLDKLAPSIKSRGLNLLKDLNNEALVFADKNMIDTAIRNVVSNARKFTPSGGTLNVTSEIHQIDGAKFHGISIEDSGMGIPEDMMAHLFSRHHVNVRKDTEGNKGIGLGLLISSEFVHKNAGKILLTSKIGTGTTFKILLPSLN